MLGINLDSNAYLSRFQDELSKLDQDAMQRMADLIYDAWDKGRFVFFIGNGGSGTTATHMSEDLGKSLVADADLRDESVKRLKVMSLTDNLGWIMAVGNDLDYDQIFVQQLMNYGSKDDVLIALSGSGNSGNILTAVDWANRHGLKTFGLTGYSGGKLKATQQDGLHVALDDMGMVESIHLSIYHWVLNDVHARIYSLGRHAHDNPIKSRIA